MIDKTERKRKFNPVDVEERNDRFSKARKFIEDFRVSQGK